MNQPTTFPAMLPRDWAALLRAGFRIERAPPLTPAQIHAVACAHNTRAARTRERQARAKLTR